MSAQNGRKCTECGCSYLITLQSLGEVRCAECPNIMPLENKPVVVNNRIKNETNKQ